MADSGWLGLLRVAGSELIIVNGPIVAGGHLRLIGNGSLVVQHPQVKGFWSDIEPTFPRQGWPTIEVELRKLCGFPEGRGNGITIDDILEIRLTLNSIAKAKKNCVIGDMPRLF
jgi:hypothetical protein